MLLYYNKLSYNLLRKHLYSYLTFQIRIYGLPSLLLLRRNPIRGHVNKGKAKPQWHTSTKRRPVA
jgi:hypothetical protein